MQLDSACTESSSPHISIQRLLELQFSRDLKSLPDPNSTSNLFNTFEAFLTSDNARAFHHCVCHDCFGPWLMDSVEGWGTVLPSARISVLEMQAGGDGINSPSPRDGLESPPQGSVSNRTPPISVTPTTASKALSLTTRVSSLLKRSSPSRALTLQVEAKTLTPSHADRIILFNAVEAFVNLLLITYIDQIQPLTVDSCISFGKCISVWATYLVGTGCVQSTSSLTTQLWWLCQGYVYHTANGTSGLRHCPSLPKQLWLLYEVTEADLTLRTPDGKEVLWWSLLTQPGVKLLNGKQFVHPKSNPSIYGYKWSVRDVVNFMGYTEESKATGQTRRRSVFSGTTVVSSNHFELSVTAPPEGSPHQGRKKKNKENQGLEKEKENVYLTSPERSSRRRNSVRSDDVVLTVFDDHQQLNNNANNSSHQRKKKKHFLFKNQMPTRQPPPQKPLTCCNCCVIM